MIMSYQGITPKVHQTAFIVDTAQIIGDVEIGKDSSVWFNSVIRGDVNFIRIGNRTNIQDGCVLHVTRGTHPLFLEDDITLGHSVTLHGCRIKNRCLIGMGAVVLDGAVVGGDSIVGAGSLVLEGCEIPPRTLAVGSPARVVRELTEKEIQEILESSRHYIEYSAAYRNDKGG